MSTTVDFLTTPEATDIAYGWIRALFGGGGPVSPENPGFGAAFAVFTSSLTFIAALFMGWHIVVGIVSSAYSGKVLGERYHQIYAPLRVVLGFGMLIPIAGGFSTVHYLLRDVVGVAAVQMANMPVKTYLEARMDSPMNGHLVSAQGVNMANKVLEYVICANVVQGINEHNTLFVNKATASVPTQATPVPVVTGTGNSIWRWDFGHCGSMAFTAPTDPGGGFLEDSEAELTNFNTVRAEATQELITTINSGTGIANWSAFREYFGSKKTDFPVSAEMATQLSSSGVVSPQIVTTLQSAAERWADRVGTASNAVFSNATSNNKDRLLQRLNEYGFIVAGSYERSISSIAALSVSLANDLPAGSVSNPGSWHYDEAFDAAKATVAAVKAQDAMSAFSGEVGTGDGLGFSASVANLFSPAMAKMKAGTYAEDPVGDMVQFGQNMLTYASVIIMGMIAAVVAAGAAQGASDGVASSVAGWVGAGVPTSAAAGAAAAFFQYIAGWVNWMLMIMIIVGVLHAYVFPMLPMIMVFVMATTWLIMFLEAAIAGVLWAFAFVRMDGQEFFDRNQAPGVTLIFNLFLRPAIGMLAFIGSLIILPEMLRALTIVWDASFYAQVGGGGWLTVWAWLAGLIIFTWMQWHLCLRLYGLIPTIADRVGHWMGFQSHGYNDGAETSAAAGAMVAAGGAFARAPIAPAGGIGGGGRRPPGGGTPGGGAGGPSPTGGGGGGGGGGSSPAGSRPSPAVSGRLPYQERIGPKRPRR